MASRDLGSKDEMASEAGEDDGSQGSGPALCGSLRTTSGQACSDRGMILALHGDTASVFQTLTTQALWPSKATSTSRYGMDPTGAIASGGKDLITD